jgi:hypothetical protein
VTLLSQMSDMLCIIYSPHVFHFTPTAGKTEPTFTGLNWRGFPSLAEEYERHVARHPFLMAVLQCKQLFSFVRNFRGANKMFWNEFGVKTCECFGVPREGVEIVFFSGSTSATKRANVRIFLGAN